MKRIKNTLPILSNINLHLGDTPVLKNFTLDIPDGKITCIVGPSGCGKTTILNTIAGLITPNSGEVNATHEQIGYIFQEDRLLPWKTVIENIGIVKKEKNLKRIDHLLEVLDLSAFGNRYPEQLSGGMRQRCAIGRGFYYGASILLMDEPFKSLDCNLRTRLIKYLTKLWNEDRNTILFVTHDIDEALLLGHQVIVLSKPPLTILKSVMVDEPHENRQPGDIKHLEKRAEIIRLIGS